MSSRVDWIGYQIEDRGDRNSIEIKESFYGQLRELTDAMAKANMIGIKKLDSFTGEASHVANLLFAWKPFLQPLWAAITQARGKNSKKSKFNKSLRKMIW